MVFQEYIRWVGHCIYMACWVGITNHRYWWFTTNPYMDKGAPFRLHQIIYCNQFDDILIDIWYTNKEVPHEDGFPHMRKLEEAWNQNVADQFLP